MTKEAFETLIEKLLKIQRDNCADAFMDCYLYKLKKGKTYHAIKQADKPKFKINEYNNKQS